MNWFYNMKIGKKLLSSFIVVALLAGVAGSVSIFNLNKINEDYTEMYLTNGTPLGELGEVGMNFQMNRVHVRNVLTASSAQEKQEYIKLIQHNDTEFANSLKVYEQSIRTESDQEDYDLIVKTAEEYTAFRDNVINLALAGNIQEAQKVLVDNAAVSEKMDQAIRNIFTKKQENGLSTVNTLNDTAQSTMVLLLVIVAIAMLLAVLLGIFISRNISRPITKLVDVSNQIADGNLAVNIQVRTKDEIGMLEAAFAKMVENINEVMTNIRNAADQVATGAKQMSESSILLSQGATEQASSVEQLTASLEEVSTKIHSNATQSDESNRLTQLSKENALQGNTRMQEMLTAMDDINASSANISKIIKVIDEIAFQTNILALNAAVEAARAGQHGKGFAVVAEEVRNLAARSANAAKETTEMIESSIQKVEGGMKIAAETAEALTQIVENITKVAEISNSITLASNEQASGIAQINQGLLQVSQVIQTNSSTSEESAAASEELSSQANMMKAQVARFRIREISHQQMFASQNNLYSYNNDQAFAAAASELEPIVISDKEFGKY